MPYTPAVLIADPELSTCLHLEQVLSNHKYQVTFTTSFTEYQQYNQTFYSPYTHHILSSGFYSQLQAKPVTARVLILIEQDEKVPIEALLTCADDFVIKPINTDEIVARLKASARRCNTGLAPQNQGRPQKSPPLDTTALALTGAEYALLQLLTLHPHTLLSKAYLCNEGLHRNYTPGERSIDVHISRIRQKLALVLGETNTIRSVRNRGYIFSPPQ